METRNIMAGWLVFLASFEVIHGVKHPQVHAHQETPLPAMVQPAVPVASGTLPDFSLYRPPQR